MTLQGKRQLDARLRAIGDTERLLRGIQIHGVRYAKMGVPRKTSNLSRTIRVGAVSDTSASIIAGGERKVGYASAVERGTKPRIIRPRAGRVGRNGRPAALAWGGPRTLGGRLRSGASPTHFARSVKHPGSRSKPYLVPGLKRAAEEQGITGLVELWNSAA